MMVLHTQMVTCIADICLIESLRILSLDIKTCKDIKLLLSLVGIHMVFQLKTKLLNLVSIEKPLQS